MSLICPSKGLAYSYILKTLDICLLGTAINNSTFFILDVCIMCWLL